MQSRRINCTVGAAALVAVWALMFGFELAFWLAGATLPPATLMTLVHAGLASGTVVYAICRKTDSARASFELGREVERTIPSSRSGSPSLRAVDDAAAR